jgi:alkylation response protein AidB-like acyl-CoA dehydrogenase
MDFDFNEQQNMLKTMARDFLVNECPKARVRELEAEEKGYDPAMWAKIMGNVTRLYMMFPGIAIAGGTDEVQKNIVGQFKLGLPRAY